LADVRTLGIVGGIAPASTVDYYRSVITTWRERRGDDSYPSIVINSIDLARLVELVTGNRLGELTEWLVSEVKRLAGAGADFGLLASNTPHIVFDEVARASPIPLLSIVEAASEAAADSGLRTVGLLGTRYTMQGRFYPDVFARRGIKILAPSPDDRTYVHDRYMGELIVDEFTDETRRGVLAVIDRLREAGAEAVLLAGTELPLLLRDAAPAVPLLDTTQIHVRRAVAELLA
jgi:aspartate racemase